MKEEEKAYYFDALTEEMQFNDDVPLEVQIISKNVIRKHLKKANEELKELFEGIRLP